MEPMGMPQLQNETRQLSKRILTAQSFTFQVLLNVEVPVFRVEGALEAPRNNDSPPPCQGSHVLCQVQSGTAG